MEIISNGKELLKFQSKIVVYGGGKEGNLYMNLREDMLILMMWFCVTKI